MSPATTPSRYEPTAAVGSTVVAVADVTGSELRPRVARMVAQAATGQLPEAGAPPSGPDGNAPIHHWAPHPANRHADEHGRHLEDLEGTTPADAVILAEIGRHLDWDRAVGAMADRVIVWTPAESQHLAGRGHPRALRPRGNSATLAGRGAHGRNRPTPRHGGVCAGDWGRTRSTTSSPNRHVTPRGSPDWRRTAGSVWRCPAAGRGGLPTWVPTVRWPRSGSAWTTSPGPRSGR